MSTVRRDIFTGNYVIISEARANRPLGIITAQGSYGAGSKCPFCPGNEHITPHELYKDGENWSIRSFPNKYPALTENSFSGANQFFGEYNGAGEHEVLVDTRNHNENLYDFTAIHIEKLFEALQERYGYYYGINETKYVQIFKNNGLKAGATQHHSHWQIVAGRFIPSAQDIIGGNLTIHKHKTGGCLYCEMIENERVAKERVVLEDDLFLALAPYASRFTYETWILPKNHYSCFSELTKKDIKCLSVIFKEVLVRLKIVCGKFDYNILLMDSPKTDLSPLYHWHIQILPRMGTLAGYEFSTGSYINHITPEQAALALRQ